MGELGLVSNLTCGRLHFDSLRFVVQRTSLGPVAYVGDRAVFDDDLVSALI